MRRWAIGLLALACVRPVGGWDLAALEARHPVLRSIADHRLGDLRPYPALVDGHLVLVTCRFAPPEGAVSVQPEGARWPTDWAEETVASLDRALPSLALRLRPIAATAPIGDGIRVRSIDAAEARGPRGLADTLSECDVSVTPADRAPVRGRITQGEIRIRRRIVASAGLTQEASAEEWVAALLHELAHALGFQGHAALGDSPLVLDQHRLRALGRRVLAGEPIAAPNLRALYALPPGTRLGEVRLDAGGRGVVAAAVEAVAARSAAHGPPRGPFATVGDREARLAWRWNDGNELALAFPDWAEALRWRRPVGVRLRPAP